jgi:hypothetical protein
VVLPYPSSSIGTESSFRSLLRNLHVSRDTHRLFSSSSSSSCASLCARIRRPKAINFFHLEHESVANPKNQENSLRLQVHILIQPTTSTDRNHRRRRSSSSSSFHSTSRAIDASFTLLYTVLETYVHREDRLLVNYLFNMEETHCRSFSYCRARREMSQRLFMA